MKTIGILALQGGYAAHASVLNKLNIPWQFVRSREELRAVDGLIIPGGESPTFLKLLQETNLLEEINNFTKPLFGTCAGAILLAKTILASNQKSFQRVDISIERNAYGRQLSSFIAYGTTQLSEKPIEMVFIRAPRIKNIYSQDVEILAMYENEPVAVFQNNTLIATFHPELTHNTVLHQYFVDLVYNYSYADLSN